MSRWKRSNTCVYNISYHIIWTPKYRTSILKGKIREKIKQYLFEKSRNDQHHNKKIRNYA